MTDVRDEIEREAKFSAWPGFEVPDLTGVLPGYRVEPHSELLLDAVYYDTKDLRLIRSGITLRRRTEDARATWTVKFPQPTADDGVLRRRELSFDDESERVPRQVAALVRACVRSEGLDQVARLQTRRRSFRLVADHDRAFGEIDDDEVSVLDADRIAARFREVEAEVFEHAPRDLLVSLSQRLIEAGAGVADPTPKLVRALGPRALAPPDLQAVSPAADASVGQVLQAGLTNAVLRIIEHHHVILLDDDPEGVHQARVGTRRLRSDLRTFRPMLIEEWSEPLRSELGWLGAELGRVRDADVLLHHLLADTDTLAEPDDRLEARLLLEQLQRQRDLALEQLLASLDSPRYVDLIDRLADAVEHPRLRRSADKPARRALPDLVGIPWRKLRKAVRALPREPADTELHRIRILVKRDRYAAEVAVPVLGSPAREFVRELAGLQELLGDHQDAAVAEDWLREASRSVPPAQALVAGQLIAVQQARAGELRAQWPARWARLDRKKLTSWLR